MLPKELQIEVFIPKTPLAECKTFNWFKGEKGDKGDKGDTGNTGATGQDGFSPTANVAKEGGIVTISITDKNGTTTESLDIGGKANTDLANVSANIDYVIECKAPTASDPSWYEVWRSGKIKQGGYNSNAGHTSTYTATITLLKPMADTSYCIYRTPDKGGIANSPATQWAAGVNANTKTTTSFQFFTDQVGYIVGDFWMVIGQGA